MIQQTVVWGSFCLVALGAAIRWPRLTRRVLGGFFVVMALGVNVVYALADPQWFVTLGTAAPLLPVYAWAFGTVVAAAPAGFGVAVATYEVAVGVGMILGGRFGRWALAGGVAFLVASAPLGPWTLPNLVLAMALAVIAVREARELPVRRPGSAAAVHLGTGKAA